jgi:opacity protein-like surface antigen
MRRAATHLTLLLLALLAWPPAHALAEDAAGGGGSRTLQPEEDDYRDTPFTKYGEFNDEEDEAADTLFFQFGRLFGVSVGAGYEGVSGNRGLLYAGGFPAVDLKVHYWFDFNFALSLGFMQADHSYQTQVGTTTTRYQLSIFRLGVDLKYYFDTKDMAAPISFANPYVLAGMSAFNKREISDRETEAESDNKPGFSVGAGLEFTIRPRKSYFFLEGKLHAVRFDDTSSDELAGENAAPPIGDRSGLFYTMVVGILFTW